MKIYNVEKERLQLFIDRYENFIKTAPFVKKEFSPADKDCLSMMLIDFCCICEQNPKSDAYWNNELINNFVKDNSVFYNNCKVLSDSFVAHLDHSDKKALKVMTVSEKLGLLDSISLKKFCNLCKNIISTAEII